MLTAVLLSSVPFLLQPASAEEAESDTPEGQDEVIQRILELRQQIEDLLEILPEDVRQEVEQRWRDRQAKGSEERQEIDPETGPETTTDVALEPESERHVTPARESQAATQAMDTVETPIEEDLEAETVPACGGFHLFDTNEDSLVTAGDRPWRYLRLWFDSNGDGAVQEPEIESLFDLAVRQIDVGLRFYNNEDGDSEDMDVDDFIWLRKVGKGKTDRRSGALAVAADRLARAGHLMVLDVEGVQLSGYQPLGSITFLETGNGTRHPVLCQESGSTP